MLDVSPTPVILGALLNDYIIATQCKQNKTMVNEKEQKKVTLFLSIDVLIQLQALSVHALPSQLYILQCVKKKTPCTAYPAAKHHNKKFSVTDVWTNQ